MLHYSKCMHSFETVVLPNNCLILMWRRQTCVWMASQPARAHVDGLSTTQQICVRCKRHMWAHVVYDHGGEAERGDSVLCDDGCPFTNLLLHPNEHIHMTSVCWFSVLAYVCQLYSYFPSSAVELNNMKDLRQWIKRRVMLELFLFIYHCMKSWMPCWGVLVDLDWMSVLAVSACVYACASSVCVCMRPLCLRTIQSTNTFLTSDVCLV